MQFRLKHPDGRTEVVLVDAERALIGSAAHCEVRLPPDLAAREHVEVFAPALSQLHIVPRSFALLLDGHPCTTEGAWPLGSTLMIGGVAITAETVDIGIRQRGRSPLWVFVPMLIIGATIAMYVYQIRPRPQELVIPQATPLFDAPIATCEAPPPTADLLPAYAAEKHRLALAKRERGPFSATDAVESVPLFETAAACFHLAAQPDDEREAWAAAVLQRRKLEEEYHVRRVRLEHAFRIGDPFTAKGELLVLVPMTKGRSGPYVEWLVAVDRQATLEVERRINRRTKL